MRKTSSPLKEEETQRFLSSEVSVAGRLCKEMESSCLATVSYIFMTGHSRGHCFSFIETFSFLFLLFKVPAKRLEKKPANLLSCTDKCKADLTRLQSEQQAQSCPIQVLLSGRFV